MCKPKREKECSRVSLEIECVAQSGASNGFGNSSDGVLQSIGTHLYTTLLSLIVNSDYEPSSNHMVSFS
jgi:hypothetical protein